jgi:hypothetical protein
VDAPSNGQNDAVPIWKPHALAQPHTGQINLRTGDKVRATVDLPGVPQGSEGKVILANGFNWMRYRIRFDNGIELGDLDHRNLEPVGRAAKRLAKTADKA